MQRKKRCFFTNIILVVFFSCLMMPSAQATKPLWTFVPQTSTDITVSKSGGSAQVTYTVLNQSSTAKTLTMKPIAGITQSAPCQLPAKGNCTLVLNINGSALQGDVVGGPVLCQQGNDWMCYQPSPINFLRVRLTLDPPVEEFTVTPAAGSDGSITPATPQVVNAGSSLTFTATPDSGYAVNQWLVDGAVVQTGGTIYQLSNIQANQIVQVTFGQATLVPVTQNLALSVNDSGANPALSGTPRVIRIQNNGSVAANNVQVNTQSFPTGTAISCNTCFGTLNPGASCDITITPGSTPSPDNAANPCNTSPGVEPVPTTVTVSADNALSTSVNVLVLSYGCIYQGGFLFSVDDSTSSTSSIAGKAAALTDEEEGPGDFVFRWSTVFDITTAVSITDGLSNSNALESPAGQYPVAQACLNKSDGGFLDWFAPSICELGRYVGVGSDAGCGTTNPNLYTSLHTNNLGSFISNDYWSSTQFSGSPQFGAWLQSFATGEQVGVAKNSNVRVRCIRAFSS